MVRFLTSHFSQLTSRWSQDLYHVVSFGLLLGLTIPASASGAVGLIAIWAMAREFNRIILHVSY